MGKRIMREFRMTEISGVDRPAQKGAVFTFMKRDATDSGPYLAKRDGEGDLPAAVEAYLKRIFTQDQRDHAASSGVALPDGSFPVENRADLRNAVRAIGRASNPAKAKAHIISRARSLGATSSLPDDWNVGKLLKSVTNADAVSGFQSAVDAFAKEQADAGVVESDALVKSQEFANALLTEVSDCVVALKAVADEILEDAGITTKNEALQESFGQFTAHLKGIIPEGIENGLVGAALAEAGYTVNERGALTKRETDMGFDIRKALGLSATATDADIEKAFGVKTTPISPAVLKMSGSHLAYLAKARDPKAKKPMPDEDCAKFSDMSEADRDTYIKANPVEKAKKKPGSADDDLEDELDGGADEDTEKCIKLATGEVIRKSVVGESTFAFMKAQQDRISKMEDAEATATFTKRAETDMTYIGKSDELGGLLRSIAKLAGGEKIAEAVAKKFEQLNVLIKKGGTDILKEVGKNTTGGDSFAKAADQIETIAKQMVADGKAKNLYKARDMARQANPDLRKQESDEAAEARKTRAA